MEKFRDCYVPNQADRFNPCWKKICQTLPLALVVNAGFDVLRDKGEVYARRLEGAGVQVKSIRVAGVIHGFMKMDRILSQPNDVLMEINSFIETGGIIP